MHLSAKPAVAVGHKHALLQPKGFPQPFHDGRNSLRSAGYDKGICQSWSAENFRARAQRHEYAARHRARTRSQGGGVDSARRRISELQLIEDADHRKGQVLTVGLADRERPAEIDTERLRRAAASSS